MEMNATDGGNRRFICVQIPQMLKDTGNNFKANNVAIELGYSNLCDIGEERIRRAGNKIRDEKGAIIDYGFRVFKVDTTNMEDVYYRPTDYDQGQLSLFANNIKGDRIPEDLLFQIMLDLGIQLSAELDEEVIDGKKFFLSKEVI